MGSDLQERKKKSTLTENVKALDEKLKKLIEPNAPTQGAEAADDTEEMPSSIGRFQISAQVGKGGFGIVYAAYDPMLQREVAVKVPRAGLLGNTKLIERFVREVKAVASLEHPNILPVLDAGLDGNTPYLISPLYAGPDLAKWLRLRTDQMLPVTLVVRWMEQLAQAVDHAHRRGIIHRDIKPSNILLDTNGDVENPSQWVPKLTDFGLAKALHSDEEKQELTVSGDTLGTPEYMAPEQVAGDHRNIGVATDIHGLGAVMHEMLMGVSPYGCHNRADTLRKILNGPPSIPSFSKKPIPPDLQAVIEKCLAKQPEDRYVSAMALTDDLQRFQQGLPTKVRPLTLGGRAVRWVRRHPAAASLLAVIAGLLLVMLINVFRNEIALRENVQAKANVIEAAQLKEASYQLDDGRQEIALETLTSMPDHRASPLVYRLLMNRIWDRGLVMLPGHHDRIGNMFLSSNQQYLMTLGWDSSALLWDLKTGSSRPLLNEQEHAQAGVIKHEAVFTNLQKQLCLWDQDKPLEPLQRFRLTALVNGLNDSFVTCSRNQQVVIAMNPITGFTVHDRRTGATVHGDWPWETRKDNMLRGWCNPSGRWLLVQDHQQAMHLWSLPDGKYVGPCMPSVNYPVMSIRFRDETNECFLCDYTGQVVRFNPVTKQFTTRHSPAIVSTHFSIGSQNVQSAVWHSPDAPERLYCGSKKGVVYCCNLETGEEVQLAQHPSEVEFVLEGAPGEILSMDCQKLFSIDAQSRTVKKTWNVPGELVKTTKNQFLDMAVYQSTQRALILGGADGRIAFWKFDYQPKPAIIPHPTNEAHSITFSPDSKILATGGDDDGNITLWNTATQEKIRTLRGHRSLVCGMVFSPNGKTLISGSYDKCVRRWNVETGKCELIYDPAPTSLKSLVYSPRHQLIVAGCKGGKLIAWNLHDPKPCRQVDAHTDHVDALCLSPDETRIYSGAQDRFIKVWDLANGHQIDSMAEQQQVWKIKLHQNQMVVTGQSRNISVWNANTFKLEKRFRDPHTSHRALALSPDGETTVTGGESGPIRFWQTRTGLELAKFDIGKDLVFQLAFSPDGNYLAASCKSGRVLYYSLKE